jgi:ribosomal protein L13E
LFDSTWQGVSTALQGILAVDDESTRRCSEAVTRAQAVVVALSSAEAAASAAINLPLARQLQSQKGKVSSLLKSVTGLMAPPKRSFALQSISKLLLLGTKNIVNRSVHDPFQLRPSSSCGQLQMFPSYHSQGYPQQDVECRTFSPSISPILSPPTHLGGENTYHPQPTWQNLSEDSIACLLFRSRNTALIRAMLLAAQPDLALPPASGEHQGLINQLLLAAFTRMRDDQHSWVQAVVQAGFDASALMAAGIPVLALNHAGFSLAEVKAAGYDFASALRAGYNPASLKAAGFDLAAFRAAGCDWSIINHAGFSLAEIKAAGYDPASALRAGYNPASLKAAGFDLAAFRAAGCDWLIINHAGFSEAEVKAAGCDPASALRAGYNPASLKAAGFDLAAFRAAGCDWSTINHAGFSLAEVKAAGCDPASAQAAGFDLFSLISNFGYDAVASSGCDVSRILVPPPPYPPLFPLQSAQHGRTTAAQAPGPKLSTSHPV